MGKITLLESKIDLTHERKGKLAVFMHTGQGNPVEELTSAVSQYVGNAGHKEFVDIENDNPSIRVVISNINDLYQQEFDPSKHRLSNI